MKEIHLITCKIIHHSYDADNCIYLGMHGEQKGPYGGQEVTLGVHLQLFKAGHLTGKRSSII